MRFCPMELPLALLAAWVAPLGAQSVPGTVRLAFTNTARRADHLELTGFLRDGRPLDASDLQVRRLGEGVTEISATSPGLANWEFRLRESEPVYGFGERYDALNQVRRVLVNASSDLPEAKGSGTYIPIPFFMDLRGYGLWVDTYAEATFDLGASDHDTFVVRLRDTRLRIVFFEGPQFPLILERYTGMVGRAKLPPYWAFAPWKSRNWHPRHGGRLRGRRALPAARPARVGAGLGQPLGDELQHVPDEPAAVQRSRGDGPAHPRPRLQAVPVAHGVHQRHDVHAERAGAGRQDPADGGLELRGGAASRLLPQDRLRRRLPGDLVEGTGRLVDFTNPAATAWWQDQVRKAIRLGADAFKADGGEGSFIRDARFADGEDAAVMRTRYSVLYDRALESLIQSDLHGDGVPAHAQRLGGQPQPAVLLGRRQRIQFRRRRTACRAW